MATLTTPFQSARAKEPKIINNKNIYRGITTGLNKAFIIDNDTKNALVSEDSKSVDLLRPLLRGRDIGRYQSNWKRMWIIDTHNGFGNTARIDVDLYPAIKQRLDSFSPKLDNRYDQGTTKYNLRSCAYHAQFDKEKIVYAEIVEEPKFFLDHGHFYPDATAFIMTGSSLKYLIGVLNSKPAWYFFSNFYAIDIGASGVRYKKDYLKWLPVPKVSNSNQELIDQIESLIPVYKISNRISDQIDDLVCNLYSLSATERKLVLTQTV